MTTPIDDFCAKGFVAVRDAVPRRWCGRTSRSSRTSSVVRPLLPDRVEFSAFERDGARDYEFVGNGSDGGLLAGYSCPTSNGGPNGIWQWDVFPVVPFQGIAPVP
jgi:hypothetical protein